MYLLESVYVAMVWAAAKGALLLAVAAGLMVVLRRARPAVRHLVWAGALAGAAALPVLGALLPDVEVPLLSRPLVSPAATAEVWSYGSVEVAAEPTPVAADEAGVAVTPEAMIAPVVEPPGPAMVTPAPPAPPAVVAPVTANAPWSFRIFLIWTAGFVAVSVALAVGMLRTHVVACQAAPAPLGGTLHFDAQRLARRLGLRRAVQLATLDGAVMPMTWGTIRPVVLLPAAAEEWPAAQREQVLLHELAHVRRCDALLRIVATIACALYWFNPLVWIAAARLRHEQELACDDEVLAAGARASDYAANLVAVARGVYRPVFGAAAAATVAMARPSQLGERVAALLNDDRPRAAPRLRLAVAAWFMAILVTVPLAAAVPGMRSSLAPEPAFAPLPDVAMTAPRAASPLKEALAPLAAAPAGLAPLSGAAVPAVVAQDRCNWATLRGTSSSNSNQSRNRVERTTLSISNEDCRLEANWNGRITFTDDERDVATLGAGGEFELVERGPGINRRVRIRPAAGGNLDHRYDLDDRINAAEWLATRLALLFERTGYNIEPRVRRIMEREGLEGVLSRAEATSSSYVRRRYLEMAGAATRFTPAQLTRVIGVAASISSDHEKAELLTSLMGRYAVDAAMASEIVGAAASMRSGYETRRVLTAALTRPGLPERAVVEAIGVAGRIGSDHERAEVLTTLLEAQPIGAASVEPLAAATRGMRGDYEKSRVLAAILAARPPQALIPHVVEIAAAMRSSHEKSEVLIAVARRYGQDPEVRPLVERAAAGISGSYERERVLASLSRRN